MLYNYTAHLHTELSSSPVFYWKKISINVLYQCVIMVSVDSALNRLITQEQRLEIFPSDRYFLNCPRLQKCSYNLYVQGDYFKVATICFAKY